jgi:hypothetical protein
MAIGDEDIDELAKRVEERQSRGSISRPVQAIPNTIKIIIIIGLSLMFYLANISFNLPTACTIGMMSKEGVIGTADNLKTIHCEKLTTLSTVPKIIIIAIFAIVFFAVGSQPLEQGLLPEQEIVATANKQLVYKQKHSLHAGYRQVNDPNAIIRVHLQGMLVRDEWAGKPLYWEHGFSITTRDGTSEYHASIMNDPFTAMCLGIKDRPEGYSGREEPEKEIIKSSDLRKQLLARKWDAQFQRGE